ncbi:ribonucleoside-triphosphate reductase [Haloferula luteola]|uniref:Ribonucleoside-triphosphate reductase n=1 Tax=Haloferula luteola TaxID=595692 RepID=A0A840UX34_9BACT|nr:anaerobic ribonucleoside-triphosphate reductase [Haloferula luteola]MBB5350295.1 ribonucleoside-triphosphate reductase [Haloferula luteola]
MQRSLEFIDRFIAARNSADGSLVDANANVTSKNAAVLAAEIHKEANIRIHRALMERQLTRRFGPESAAHYRAQLENHEIYTHDETAPFMPYCASVSLYPMLREGLVPLGGESQAPKHLASFCGSFINYVFAVSANLAGACATVEFLNCFDHFARKDYGDHYLVDHEVAIANHLQHVIYALNQPAAARSYQSVFWNISLFDENYFEGMFGDFVFPDGDVSKWESVKRLQAYFLGWFNSEREKSLLTFPVVTAAFVHDREEAKDAEFAELLASELSRGNSFFIYSSDSVDSLSSCCRLRNALDGDNDFSFSLGAGGVMTGSMQVMTINFNRLVQDGRDLTEQVKWLHRYLVARRDIIQEFDQAGLLPIYTAKCITLDKQYLTIGVNGMVEAAEFLGLDPSNNEAYISWVSGQLRTINLLNRDASRQFGARFNTEFVPAENLGVKFARWDREAGYSVPRDCYNSYFYPVEREDVNVLDKLILHGEQVTQYLDGGSALHLNLESYATQESFAKLIRAAIRTGCNYFCTNVRVTCCNDCGRIDKWTRDDCPHCGSRNIDYATRIIGYLKRVSSWSSDRQQEHDRRAYQVEQGS